MDFINELDSVFESLKISRHDFSSIECSYDGKSVLECSDKNMKKFLEKILPSTPDKVVKSFYDKDDMEVDFIVSYWKIFGIMLIYDTEVKRTNVYVKKSIQTLLFTMDDNSMDDLVSRIDKYINSKKELKNIFGEKSE